MFRSIIRVGQAFGGVGRPAGLDTGHAAMRLFGKSSRSISYQRLIPLQPSAGIGRAVTSGSRFGILRRTLATKTGKQPGDGSTVKFLGGLVFVAGGLTVGTVFYLDLSTNQLKEMWDEQFGEPLPEEEPIENIIDQPSMVAPEDFVHPYSLKPWLPFIYKSMLLSQATGSKEEVAVLRQEWCDALVIALNKAGCSMIKFGQWISMRPDMFPADLIHALSGLRDNVPPHSFAETLEQIETSFGRKPEDIFEEIAEEAVASGSVAQVHRCKLRPQYSLPDGSTDVAVKVRHPGALAETYIDIYLIFAAIPIINWASSFAGASDDDKPNLSIPFAKDAFHEILQKQVDFRWEAYNLVKFVRNFGREVKIASNSIRFPYVLVGDLLSEAVLVESWAQGSTISDLFMGHKGDSLDQESKSILAQSIFDLTVKMFLRDNFIHGDLHAGNLLYDTKNKKITVLDAGLVTCLEGDSFYHFGDFLRALCTMDVPVVAAKLILFHDNTGSENAAPPSFEDISKGLAQIYSANGLHKPGASLAQAMGDIVGEIMRVLPSMGVCLRGDVASSLATISIAEGLIMQLDPDYDILTQVMPYFVRYRGWDSADAVMDSDYQTTEAETKDFRAANSMTAAEMAAIAEAEAGKALEMEAAPKSVALGALSGPTFQGEVTSKEDEDKLRAQAQQDWELMQAELSKTKQSGADAAAAAAATAEK